MRQAAVSKRDARLLSPREGKRQLRRRAALLHPPRRTSPTSADVVPARPQKQQPGRRDRLRREEAALDSAHAGPSPAFTIGRASWRRRRQSCNARGGEAAEAPLLAGSLQAIGSKQKRPSRRNLCRLWGPGAARRPCLESAARSREQSRSRGRRRCGDCPCRTKAATSSAPPTRPELVQGDHLGAELRDSLTPVARVSEGIDHRTLRTSDQGAGADGSHFRTINEHAFRQPDAAFAWRLALRDSDCPAGLVGVDCRCASRTRYRAGAGRGNAALRRLTCLSSNSTRWPDRVAASARNGGCGAALF